MRGQLTSGLPKTIHSVPYNIMMYVSVRRVLVSVYKTAKYKRRTPALSVVCLMDEIDVTGGVKSIYNLISIERSFSKLSNGVRILFV